MAVTSPYAFCTKADIERRLGSEGVRLRQDHDDSGTLSSEEQAVVTDAISDASETILYYTWAKYDPVELAKSAWINRRTVDLACYVLCGVRGNPIPDNVYRRAQETQEFLIEIRGGAGMIPAIPLRRRLAPAWSNSRVDPRYRYKVVRVDPQTSSASSGHYPVVVDWQAQFTFEI